MHQLSRTRDGAAAPSTRRIHPPPPGCPGMPGPWASLSLLVGGAALVAAGVVFPFLPPTAGWFLIEDAFEDPGLLLVALGALAGRQRLWPLGAIGALVVLAV